MSLEFDGATQYIKIAQTKDLPIYNEVTYSICGWVKASAQDDKRIFAEGGTSSKNQLLAIGSGSVADGKTDKFHVYIRTDAGSVLLNANSTTTVFDDAWHHFCWIDNNGDVDLYIDGILDATNFDYTRSGTFTLNRTGIASVIRAAVGYWLNGELFDIRCYNRALTANEIAEIYHKRGADRVWQGLVGWWRLDELSSGTPAPILLDSMDSTSDYTVATNGTISLNTTTYQEGTGAMNAEKITTSVNYFFFRKAIAATNVSNQNIKLWVYIKNETVLNKISKISFTLYSTLATNGKRTEFTNLNVGWNLLSRNINDFEITYGTFDPTAVLHLYYAFGVNNNSYTTSGDDVVYDFAQAGDYTPNSIIDLSGNGNHGTPYNSPVYQASPHRLRRGVLVS